MIELTVERVGKAIDPIKIVSLDYIPPKTYIMVEDDEEDN